VLPAEQEPHEVGGTDGLDLAAQAVHDALATGGAAFTVDLARATGLLPATVEDALWTLVARGLVTGDGIGGLRSLIDPPDDDRRLRMLRGGRGRLVAAGRWALLHGGAPQERTGDADVMRFARLLLRRWGLVMRELVTRETVMPPWRLLLQALRTLEARGEVRGGRFVAGMVGEQFALPEAVEALRAVRRRDPTPETVVVAAADPLNLVGIVVPGARVSPLAHEVIAWRDGVPVEVGELGTVRSRLGAHLG
jgi:ATP-dependent Lhr-like helicase